MDIFTVLYISLVVALVLAFFLKNQIQRLLVHFARALLVVSLIGSLVGVFMTKPFVYVAETSLKNSGTLETIRKIDTALPVEKVITPVSNLVERIKELWNRGEEKPSLTVTESKTQRLGLLEAEVYPNLVFLTAQSYKIATMLVSILGLVLSVYLNFSVSGISELAKLKKQYELLEQKLDNGV